MAYDPIPRLHCAENISLLSLLHRDVPVKPKRNAPRSPSSRSDTYILPLDKERSLAGTLAFISSTRNDSNHIPAVCVGEGPNSDHIEIFVAVNKINFDDGKVILCDVERGFKEIFGILERLDGTVEHDILPTETAIFNAIVSMCSSRILCRLGLMISGKARSRRPIGDNLSIVLDYTKRLDHDRDPHIISFLQAAKESIKLIDSWCKHQTPPRLASLVEGIYRLHQQQTVHKILDLMSNKDMDPSSQKNLSNIISKVARYRESAQFLCRVARKHPIVRRAKIETVGLRQSAFQCFYSNPEYNPQLLETILRVAPKMKGTNFKEIWHLLKKTESEAIHLFSTRTRKTLQQAKIHAEVQLIYHCELRSMAKFPRIICSSKDACYMCNAFISIHGMAHTPRCHGRLYPGWRLPFIPHMDNLQQQLNRHLEAKVQDTLSTMFSSKRRIIFPFPAESTLLTLSTSSSTQDRSAPCLSPLTETQPGECLADDSHLVRSDVHTSRIALAEAESVSGDPNASMAKDTSWSNYLSLKALSDSDVLPVKFLCPGSSLTRRMTSNSPLYTAGSLEVQIEYDKGPESVMTAAHDMIYTIERLSIEDVNKREGKCHSRCIIDVKSLNGMSSHTMCNENTLYIAMHDSVIKLEFHQNAASVK